MPVENVHVEDLRKEERKWIGDERNVYIGRGGVILGEMGVSDEHG